MPALLKEDLNKILKELKINKKEYTHFVETGTWVGETILNFINEFEKLYTIEVGEQIYNEFNKKDYDRNKLKSILGDSSKMLKPVIDEIKNNTIFFLDGHFSSWPTSKGDKDVPLYEELTLINDFFNHDAVIIIDDLRLFGTNSSEDWGDISKEKLLDVVSKRVEKSFEMGDRFVIKLKKN